MIDGAPPPPRPEPEPSRFRDYAADALRYWERRRIPYNLLLAAIVVFRGAAGWPGWIDGTQLPRVLTLVALAVLANVAYSVVYLPDLFIQFAGFRDTRRHWRWIFILAGFSLAAVLTYMFSSALFGHDAD